MKPTLSTAALVLAATLLVAAAPADAAKKEYAVCTEQEANSYFGALSNERQQCKKKADYDFTSGSLPTPDQRAALCKCSALVEKLPYIEVPRCKLTLDDNQYKFKEAIESIFVECGAITIKEQPAPSVAPGSESGSGETGGESDAAPSAAASNSSSTVDSASGSAESELTSQSASASASTSGSGNDIESPPEASSSSEEAASPEPSTTVPSPSSTAASIAVGAAATASSVLLALLL